MEQTNKHGTRRRQMVTTLPNDIILHLEQQVRSAELSSRVHLQGLLSLNVHWSPGDLVQCRSDAAGLG